MVSRPAEPPREPLAKRCGSLSTHTASITQTNLPCLFSSVQTNSVAFLQFPSQIDCLSIPAEPAFSFTSSKACITKCLEMVNGFVPLKISSSYFKLNFNVDGLTQPLRSMSITATSSLLHTSRLWWFEA